jgi:4-hydroxy-3-methylbut-2-enyl diphosphate reductase
VVLIGHGEHEEVEGTVGEAPDAVVLIETAADVARLEVPDPTRVAYVTQTTLAVNDTRTIVRLLHQRFPKIVGPRTEDICYATSNRQRAVTELAAQCGLVLVVGSRNSSNTNRLVEVARAAGADAHRIEDGCDVDERWLEGRDSVGVTAGASVPEILVQRVVAELARLRVVGVEELEVCHEERRLMLPVEVRSAPPS